MSVAENKPFGFSKAYWVNIAKVGSLSSMLVLSACGGDDDDSPNNVDGIGSADPEVVEATPTPTPAAEVGDDGGVPEAANVAVSQAEVAGVGSVVVAAIGEKSGYTLYTSNNDAGGESACYGNCAATWPPFIVEDESIALDVDMAGSLGVTTRQDGTKQATYNNQPLYFYASDSQSGEATGQGVGEVWWAANVMPPLLDAATNASYGELLVVSRGDAAGYTLYTRDADVDGESSCYEACATAWPPLIVDEKKNLNITSGLPGDLGTVSRQDGSLQVTYNGQPLYLYSSDTQAGDVNGQGADDAWWVVNVFAATVKTVDSEYGQILASGEGDTLGFTLYSFANDVEAGVSACNDGCAETWPPLLVADASELELADNVSGQLDVITRDDGGLQVTYNDVPLYFYSGDASAGDTLGQGVADAWSVVEVEGVTVTQGDSELGSILVAGYGEKAGLTVYTLDNDSASVSDCYGDCAVTWPPFVVNSLGGLVLDKALPGVLSTFAREDGRLQVMYNEHPLYFYQNDQKAGDVLGEGVNDVWSVITLNPTLSSLDTEEYGSILVSGFGDKEGFSLYTFAQDTEEGVSTCYDDCAAAWPPLLVDQVGDLVLANGLLGAIGSVEREGGGLQVTYNGAPLYYYASDNTAGDTYGQGLRDGDWQLIQLDDEVDNNEGNVEVDNEDQLTVDVQDVEGLGDILVSGLGVQPGFTLYTYANDSDGESVCYGQCALDWVPLVVDSEDDLAGSEAVDVLLGVSERDDGLLQVTYDDQPLYTYQGDTAVGDATGEALYGLWFTVEINVESGDEQIAEEDELEESEEQLEEENDSEE